MDEAGQQLIDLANQRGGHDNITLVTIQVPQLTANAKVEAPRRKTAFSLRKLLAGCLVIIAAAVVIGAVAGGWLLLSGSDRSTPTVAPSPADTQTEIAPATLAATSTRTRPATSTSFFSTATGTTTPVPQQQEAFPSVTPIRIHTPTRGLPVVTNTPDQ